MHFKAMGVLDILLLEHWEQRPGRLYTAIPTAQSPLSGMHSSLYFLLSSQTKLFASCTISLGSMELWSSCSVLGVSLNPRHTFSFMSLPHLPTTWGFLFCILLSALWCFFLANLKHKFLWLRVIKLPVVPCSPWLLPKGETEVTWLGKFYWSPTCPSCPVWMEFSLEVTPWGSWFHPGLHHCCWCIGREEATGPHWSGGLPL